MKDRARITIAIDGFSSTGKSTVAKQLAKELGYIYVDSGAMYRAVTLYALENKYISKKRFNRKILLKKLAEITLAFVFNEKLGFAEIYLNDKNVEKAIRSIRVSNYVSHVSTVPEVRKFLVKIQRKMGKKNGVVMDGRDIGSVVFPNAELKIFLTADPKVRADRRLLEFQQKGITADFDEIFANVCERDKIDSSRAVSPLIRVEDAVEIDVTKINKEEQFQLVKNLALKAIDEKEEKNK